MNKLFSKIATLSVGLAMAVGVGVAFSHDGVSRVKAVDPDETLTISTTDQISPKSNGTGVSSLIMGDTSISFTDGSTPTRYWSSEVRIYSGGGTMSFDAGSNTLSKIEFTGNKTTAFTVDVGTYDSPIWTGESSTVTFTATGTVQIATISIYYKNDGPYTVTYNANGGTGTISDTKEYTSGETVTVKANSFSPSNSTFYEFGSFNTKADGSGTSYNPGDTFNISGNITLYAIWNYKEVTLGNGSYTATFPFVTAGYPKEVSVKNSSSEQVGIVSVEANGLARYQSYNEYELQTTGYILFKNHTNAVLTKAVVNVYQFNNFKLSLGTTVLHTGDGKKGSGDPVVFEITPETPTAEDIKIEHYTGTGTYTQKLYSVELYFRVGNDAVHPTGVELNATAGEVYIGKTRQLTATVSPANADDKSVSWSSNNESVATVSNSGLVTGVAAGSATITVTTTDGDLTATFVATIKTINYGTEANPLSVETARDVLEASGSGASAEKLWVRGVVYSSSYNTTNKNYTIWLQNSDGSIGQFFESYRTELDDSITTDITKYNVLKGLTVTLNGYGTIYSGTYELSYLNNTAPLVKSISCSAEVLANSILSQTKAKCDAYVDGASSFDEYQTAFTSVWTDLETKYAFVSEADRATLVAASRNDEGTTIERAMLRYDFLTGKYSLTNFITGRTPISSALIGNGVTSIDNSSTSIIIIVIASIAAISTGAIIFLKKKKHN